MIQCFKVVAAVLKLVIITVSPEIGHPRVAGVVYSPGTIVIDSRILQGQCSPPRG